MQEKRLQNKKGIYTNRDSLELFLECQFSHFFMYIPASYGILCIFFFEFKKERIKPSRKHVCSTVRKLLISHSPKNIIQ